MRYMLIFLLMPSIAFGAGVFINEPEAQHTVTSINNPTLEQYVYGNLADHPHTFTFTIEEDTDLFLQVARPTGSEYSKSLIVIREERRGVSEVGRIEYKDATWTKNFDWLLGRSLLYQNTFSAELSPGVYRVEVSSPENLGKYQLMVGTEKNNGLFSAYKRAMVGAYFFGGFLRMLFAPLIFVTVLIVGVLLYAVRRYRKREHA